MEEVFLEENDEEGQDRAHSSAEACMLLWYDVERIQVWRRRQRRRWQQRPCTCDWVCCSTLLWLVREDPADPQEEAEEAQAVEEASLGPQWCCSLGVACLTGRLQLLQGARQGQGLGRDPNIQSCNSMNSASCGDSGEGRLPVLLVAGVRWARAPGSWVAGAGPR